MNNRGEGLLFYINDFFAHPMRICFLISAVLMLLTGLIFLIDLPVDIVFLHQFLFLYVISVLAYAGFLMTALPGWHGFKGNLRTHAIIIFTLAICSLFLVLFSKNIALIFNLFAWIYLFILCVYIAYLDKSLDTFSILCTLMSMLILQIIYIFNDDALILKAFAHMHIIAGIIISFRISFPLGEEAIDREIINNPAQSHIFKNYTFIPNPYYKNIAILSVALLICILLFIDDQVSLGFAYLACSFAMFSRLLEWHHGFLIKYHFCLLMYLILLFTSLGYFFEGMSLIFNWNINYIHVVYMVGILANIYLVFNIASLRHSGRELIFGVKIILAFIGIFIATIFRTLYIILGEITLKISAILIIIAACIYLIKYLKVFIAYQFVGED